MKDLINNPDWLNDFPPPVRIGFWGWVRIILRGGLLGFVTFGCLGLLLLVRLIEFPIFRHHRPVTPYITQFVCKSAFVILGMQHITHGTPMKANGAAVANHVSWMDIFTLNAPDRVYFIAKSEVAGWPGIGWLARATGTVFIERKREKAAEHTRVLGQRIAAGHHLLFFPEGTSTDGLRVMPFKSTLFQAFLTPDIADTMMIQPITLNYNAPAGQDPRFYGWWADISFGAHLLQTLSVRRHGQVEVTYHTPVAVKDFPSRKELATYLHNTVQEGHLLTA